MESGVPRVGPLRASAFGRGETCPYRCLGKGEEEACVLIDGAGEMKPGSRNPSECVAPIEQRGFRGCRERGQQFLVRRSDTHCSEECDAVESGSGMP